MKDKLSVIILTENNQETIENTLLSLKGLANEIVIIDGESKDSTMALVRKICRNTKNCKILVRRFDEIGKQRAYGLKQATGDWVLILDSDEVVSYELKKEIRILLEDKTVGDNVFFIPFRTHYLGRTLKYGGEDYFQERLFKKSNFTIMPSLIHNKFRYKKARMAYLKGKIIHYSYRSLKQMFSKFTTYAINTAKEKKRKGEKTSLKKIFLYPLHMFWARFIKDKGYKDGFFRITLDIGFAYMEFLTYILIPFVK